MNKYILFLVTALLSIVALFFFKKIIWIDKSGNYFTKLYYLLNNHYLYIGLFFYALSFLLTLTIIHKYEISKSIPTLLAIYILTASIFAVIFQNENVTILNCIGYIFIIIGISLL
jgi:uncharacterized membrane protein